MQLRASTLRHRFPPFGLHCLLSDIRNCARLRKPNARPPAPWLTGLNSPGIACCAELKAIQDVLQEQRIQPEDVQLCEVGAVLTLCSGAGGCSAQESCPAVLQGASMLPSLEACTHLICPAAAVPAVQVANTPAKPGSEVVAAGTAAGGVPAPLQQAGGPPAGLDGPSVMLSSSDLEWGAEDGSAVDQVPELQCRSRLQDDDVPSTMSFAVSSTTFTSLAFAGEGSLLSRGTTAASGMAAGAGAPVGSASSTLSASGVGSGLRPALSRFKDEELNCPICE